jgi:protein-S-isoprenylcysteine O-methyltransferase Ste14
MGKSVVTPEAVIQLAWLVWLISWFAAAAWSNPTVKRPGFGRELIYRVLAAAGALLLFGFYPRRFPGVPGRWQVGRGINWVMVVLAVLGLLLAWWARIYLGRLWSSSVTRKRNHHVVDTGPYALVRHPIYTGIILAAAATAVVRGTAVALAGAMLVTYSLYLKARLEEAFLRKELGTDDYHAYARRVPMLVPFMPVQDTPSDRA